MNSERKNYKPLSFWSWNSDMKEEEIRWQIREFKKAGFGGFFIHSRAGRTIPYMEKEWMAACQCAIEEARSCGLSVWLYDEDGWPSGFAGGLVNGCGEDYCGKSLRFSVGTPTEADARLLAVYRMDGELSYHRIPLEEASETDLYGYYVLVREYIDIMDKAVIGKFIEVTHERYKEAFSPYFGTVIKGIFTDEPQLSGSPSWSLCMEDAYRSNYGEDILDSLWLLFVNGAGYQTFRYRYWYCVNALVKENFAGQIQAWCQENHLIFTGHFSSEDGLIYQTKSNGGVMPLYTRMGMPGIDHLGNRYASSVLLKQVSSAAHQQGLPDVLSESFGCAGWEVSFKDLLGIVGWQSVMGVNTFCTHLSAYSILGRRKRDYPAFYSYQEPWWEACHVLFGAIQKWNTVLSQSNRETKVAVLHPIRSVWCESGIGHGEEMRFLTAQFRQLVENLLDLHVDFDLLDESEIHQDQVENGTLQVGGIQYTHVIVPETLTVACHTVMALQKLVQGGGTLVFVNQRPSMVDGEAQHPAIQTIQTLEAQEVQNTRGIWQKYFRVFPVQDTYRILDVRRENEVTGIISRYGKTEDGAVLFLFNHEIGHQIRFVLEHKGKCRIEELGTFSDNRNNVTGAYDGAYTTTELTIEPQAGMLLQITPTGKVEPAKHRIVTSVEELTPVNVSPSEENALTLDMGSFCINDGEWSERKALIHLLDEIYDRLAVSREDAVVHVAYSFTAEFAKLPSALWLAVESGHVQEAVLNGQTILPNGGWWIDKGIRLYDIQKLVKNGENQVILTYHIPKTERKGPLEETFETERNRFFYEVEPESIYVRGSFDVVRREQSFVLTDPTPKQLGDLTLQGMPFYRGNCLYEGTVNYDGGSLLAVRLSGMEGTAARIFVDETAAGMVIEKGGKCDLTPYLRKGDNHLRVELLGHNRNLLGPHHHIRKKLYFVGPNSFDGTWGFADFVNPEITPGSSTWTDEYSFVPYGIQQIYLEKGRKEQ